MAVANHLHSAKIFVRLHYMGWVDWHLSGTEFIIALCDQKPQVYRNQYEKVLPLGKTDSNSNPCPAISWTTAGFHDIIGKEFHRPNSYAQFLRGVISYNDLPIEQPWVYPGVTRLLRPQRASIYCLPYINANHPLPPARGTTGQSASTSTPAHPAEGHGVPASHGPAVPVRRSVGGGNTANSTTGAAGAAGQRLPAAAGPSKASGSPAAGTAQASGQNLKMPSTVGSGTAGNIMPVPQVRKQKLRLDIRRLLGKSDENRRVGRGED